MILTLPLCACGEPGHSQEDHLQIERLHQRRRLLAALGEKEAPVKENFDPQNVRRALG